MSNLQKSKVQYLKNKETESGVCVYVCVCVGGGVGGTKGGRGWGGRFPGSYFYNP